MSGKKDFTKDIPIMALMGERVKEEEREKEMEAAEKEKKVEEIEEKKEAPKNLKKIKGYVIDPKYYMETKSQRVQMLVRPSTMEKIKKLAKKQKTSNNELLNRIIEEYLSNIGEK